MEISLSLFEYLKDRAIFAPKNGYVNAINLKLLNKIHYQTKEYHPGKRAIDDNDSSEFPVNFSNSLDVSGLPPHN